MTFDPTYSMRMIALAEGLNSKITKLDVARYMYGRMLDFTPGTNSKYSNYGYLLLSAVVEQVTGMDYFTHVQQALLQPAGLTEVVLFSTAAAGRTPDEAIAEDDGLGNSAADPSFRAAGTRGLRRRRRGQGGRRAVRRCRRLGAGARDVHQQARGLGQRRPGRRLRTFREHAGHLYLGRIPGRRRGFRLRPQHQGLAAERLGGSGHRSAGPAGQPAQQRDHPVARPASSRDPDVRKGAFAATPVSAAKWEK